MAAGEKMFAATNQLRQWPDSDKILLEREHRQVFLLRRWLGIGKSTNLMKWEPSTTRPEADFHVEPTFQRWTFKKCLWLLYVGTYCQQYYLAYHYDVLFVSIVAVLGSWFCFFQRWFDRQAQPSYWFVSQSEEGWCGHCFFIAKSIPSSSSSFRAICMYLRGNIVVSKHTFQVCKTVFWFHISPGWEEWSNIRSFLLRICGNLELTDLEVQYHVERIQMKIESGENS